MEMEFSNRTVMSCRIQFCVYLCPHRTHALHQQFNAQRGGALSFLPVGNVFVNSFDEISCVYHVWRAFYNSNLILRYGEGVFLYFAYHL